MFGWAVILPGRAPTHSRIAARTYFKNIGRHNREQLAFVP